MVTYKTKETLRPQCFNFLLHLLREYPALVPDTQMKKVVEGTTDLRKLKCDVSKTLGKVGADNIISIKRTHGSGYSLIIKTQSLQEKLQEPSETFIPVQFESASPFTSGFILSLDTMTLTHVSDLLSESGPPPQILHRCRRTYRRSLEDFALAVVYGTYIATARTFRQSTYDQFDRRHSLIDQLGNLWTHQTFEASLADGAILRSPQHRLAIGNDLKHLSTSIQFCDWAFREWMSYMAFRHLGHDESLAGC